MSARAYAFMTGVFIVILVGAIGGAIYWFSGSHVQHRPYIVITDQSIMGLHAQSTVYYRGVPVGTVQTIQLTPGDARKTRIGISIASTIPITASTFATLHTQGVTGLATIELDDTGESTPRLPTSAKKPAIIPMRGSTASLTTAGKQLAAKLNQVAASLQAILSPSNRKHINTILSNMAQVAAKLPQIEKKLNKALASLPPLTHDARHTLHHANKLVSHLVKLTDSLRKLSSQFQGVAKQGHIAVKELAHQTLPKLNATMTDIQQTANALEDLSQSLEKNPQQLLFGPVTQQPGPGEPGFKATTSP